MLQEIEFEHPFIYINILHISTIMPELSKALQRFYPRPSPLQPLVGNFLEQYGLEVLIKRDDLIDPALSGNKWRKLHLNLLEAERLEASTLLTFGGAYSNHIYAVAAAGQGFGFQTIGMIRGEQPKTFGATLRFAESCGMVFRFLSRTDYRNKNIPTDIDMDGTYLIPEGGTNCLGVKGCASIVTEVQEQLSGEAAIDYWCTSSGTGGTAAGIINQLQGQSQVLVFSSLKGDFLQGDIEQLLQKCTYTSWTNWQLMTEYHFGGYAKFKPELIEFMDAFKKQTGIALDPVYTGKMVYGIVDLAAKGFFKKGSRILIVHTGGLQGMAGFYEQRKQNRNGNRNRN